MHAPPTPSVASLDAALVPLELVAFTRTKYVPEATPGQSVGIQVRDRVRPGDLVYKIVA